MPNAGTVPAPKFSNKNIKNGISPRKIKSLHLYKIHGTKSIIFRGARIPYARIWVMLLAFGRKGYIVSLMNKTWYCNLFGLSDACNSESPQAKADHGDADAQFWLGLRFANAQGETQDYTQAARWYLKAATQNHAMAQFNLGMMHSSGQGVSKDSAQAVMWFTKAAVQGDPAAQFNLGLTQRFAIAGAPPLDAVEFRIEAYKWFHLAATKGYLGAKIASETLTHDMTLDDVAEGSRRAAAFVVTKPVQLQN